MSLVITRNLSSTLGIQTFIPQRHLNGLLPDALLRRYMFWQGTDDVIIGYPLLENGGRDDDNDDDDDDDDGDDDGKKGNAAAAVNENGMNEAIASLSYISH